MKLPASWAWTCAARYPERISDAKARSKKRKDNHSLIGHYIQGLPDLYTENPDHLIVQMDTFTTMLPMVRSSRRSNSSMQTFSWLFTIPTSRLRIWRRAFCSSNLLAGKQLFKKYVPILLTDRGSEFCDADGIEMGSDHTRRTRLFYCDPMRAVERRMRTVTLNYVTFSPKEPIFTLSVTTGQDSLNLALSHINST